MDRIGCGVYLYNPTRQTGHLVLAIIFLAVDSPSLQLGSTERGGGSRFSLPVASDDVSKYAGV